jgi:GNAT superfamily N-acetyltransferase
MVGQVRIRPCLPAELPQLIALLDEEFIVSRGRRLSLARRFPAVLDAGNCAGILLACRADTIAACIVQKRFDWIAPERTWRGAMIGLVYTRPAERGRGLATQLLRAAEQNLRAAGTAFAVLWTAQPGFYQRLGWSASDCGVFGTWSGATGAAAGAANAGGTGAGCAPMPVASVESLRLRDPAPRIQRDSASYLRLPPPAEDLQLLASPGGAAYAAYGARADHAYVYEFGGEPSAYSSLWRHISARHRTVWINERRGSPAHQWLLGQTDIHWRDQALAMWLPLAEPASARHFAEWYLPYLDRI